jgi:hypothetical protein
MNIVNCVQNDDGSLDFDFHVTREEAKKALEDYKLFQDDWDEKRIDTIGQNGNDGEHYNE